jgi:hypothetical protein
LYPGHDVAASVAGEVRRLAGTSGKWKARKTSPGVRAFTEPEFWCGRRRPVVTA